MPEIENLRKKFEMWVLEYNSHFLSTNCREKLITYSNSAQKSQSRFINRDKLGIHRSIENNGSLVKVILGWATRLFGVFENVVFRNVNNL